MRRCGIQIKVIFLHIFAVISFTARQSEQSFFENRIPSVPESHCKTDQLMTIRNSCESIFSPAIRSGSCVIVREKIPGSTIPAVIFSNRSPLPFAQVGPPSFPMFFPFSGFLQPFFFTCHDRPLDY